MTKDALLSLMDEAYTECPALSLEDRCAYGRLLAETGQLAMVHIAKIVSVSVTSLKRQGISVVGKPKGGKFHPESILTLRALEKQHRLGSGISRPLLRIARQSCSAGVVSYYTGVSETWLRTLIGA